MIYKYFTEANTTKWIDVIDMFINAYNNRAHDGVCGMSPNEARQYNITTKECHLEKVRKAKQFSFKVGDRVRVRLSKTTFERGL